jgi:phosphatidylglycerophosphate synthase
MAKNFGKIIYKNMPNIVTILGVLPLALLFSEQGYQYLIPLIVYNNIMDDLDGILAAKLNLKSDFGAKLDNVCDAVSHTLFVMAIGMHYGLACGLISAVAIAAMLVRVVSRLDPSSEKGTGSPTNELIRHVFFALLLADVFSFNPALPLIAIFLLNTVSMHLPYSMPYMVRSLTKTATTVGMVNILLISAWLFPYALPIIAGCFFSAYLYSFIKIFINMKRQKTVS